MTFSRMVVKEILRLSFLIVALVCGMNLSATPRLALRTVRGFPGNTIDVPLSLRYGTNDPRDIVALQADVIFDASGVSDGTPEGGLALTRHLLASSQPAAGVRRLLVYSLENAALANDIVA